MNMNLELLINILVIVLFVSALIFMWFKGKKPLAKQIILNMVILAEQMYGSGTGKIKFNTVMSNIYGKLPMVIRLFVTYDVLVKWIEEAVQYLKTELSADGKTLEDTLA